jgi:hypothetical protein
MLVVLEGNWCRTEGVQVLVVGRGSAQQEEDLEVHSVCLLVCW